MLTTSSGLLLAIKTADCLPVLILDEKQKARRSRPLWLAGDQQTPAGEGCAEDGR